VLLNVIMQPSVLRGRIKRCTPSVRPSVCLSVLRLRFTRNRKAVETSHLAEIWPIDTRNWKSKFEFKALKDKVTANENVKKIFSHIFAKCDQTTTNKSAACVECISPAETHQFATSVSLWNFLRRSTCEWTKGMWDMWQTDRQISQKWRVSAYESE